MDQLKKMINHTNGRKENHPINNYSRVIIEFEKTPNPLQ